MSATIDVFDETGPYLLDKDHVPYRVSDETYMAVARENFARDWKRVAKTVLPDGREVSTVFLVYNHGSLSGSPILFESLVFPDCDYMERYETWDEAMAGHSRIVKALESGG